MTELGEIPEEWEVKKLDEVSDVNPRKELLDDSDIISFIAMEDISNQGRVINKADREYGEVKKGYTPFKDNDVLLAKITPCFENGKRALVNSLTNGIGFGSTEFHVLRAKGNQTIPEYLYYIVSSHRFVSIAENNMTGSAGQKRVPTDFIRDYLLALPSVKEQARIASILSTVDEQIDNVDSLIEKNKELKKGLMQQLLTKGIGHTKFKKSEVGEIPEEWEVKSLREISFKIGDGLHGTPEYVENDIYYFINGNNLSNGRIIINDDTKMVDEVQYLKNDKNLNHHSILISLNGTIGNLAYFNYEKIMLGKSSGYVTLNNEVNREFIYYVLDCERIKNYFYKELTGTTIKNLSLDTLRKTLIAMPSVEEQEKIASILSSVDFKIEEYGAKKQKLEDLKKGLMQQLLTGKLRV